MRLARAVGAIDQPRDRGLSERETPLLGGLAIFAGPSSPRCLLAPGDGRRTESPVERSAARGGVITVVGALDDRFELPPW